MKDVIGNVITIITIGLLLIVMPMYYTGIIQWSRASVQALALTRGVIDEVIDTRTLSEDTLDDFALELAALSEQFTYKITRKALIIEPVPDKPGETYSVYTVTDNITEYNQGDLIIIDVEQIGTNASLNFVRMFINVTSNEHGNFRLVGRVR